MRARTALLIAVLGGLVTAPWAGVAAMPRSGGPWVLVISGIGGDPDHRERFAMWSAEFLDAAVERWGVEPSRVRWLAERTDLAPERVHDRSTAENIRAAFEWLAESSSGGDAVLVLLIGHGSARGSEPAFNVPGPDMGPSDFAPLLDALGDRRVAFVNTTAASSGFLELAAPGRTVITATRSPREQQATRFPDFWVEAFTDEVADTDKDGRVSVLEAFLYATAEVARSYESEGQLQTEHALLDDDGDGEGSAEPGADSSDGSLARFVALGGPVSAGPAAEVDPELARLLRERERLQGELDDLRSRREELEEDEYLDRLEALLVEIAEVDAAIRERSEEGT